MIFPQNPFIDGQARPPREDRHLQLIDPANGEAFAETGAAGPAEIEDAVAGAQRAFESGWRDLAPGKRAEILFAVAAVAPVRRHDKAEQQSSQRRRDGIRRPQTGGNGIVRGLYRIVAGGHTQQGGDQGIGCRCRLAAGDRHGGRLRDDVHGWKGERCQTDVRWARGGSRYLLQRANNRPNLNLQAVQARGSKPNVSVWMLPTPKSSRPVVVKVAVVSRSVRGESHRVVTDGIVVGGHQQTGTYCPP